VKLHDLAPAPGAHTKRTRVGRGIAAGKGKTAGRGTKGQKSRAGSSIPAWFEGGQTPIHIRVPKLRGFKRPLWRVDHQVVNIGRISAYAAAGRFGDVPANAPYTINPDTLRATGLVSNDRRPVKILGSGEVDTKLFVMADAFTASARAKIEAAGGTVHEIAPAKPAPAAEGGTTAEGGAYADAPVTAKSSGRAPKVAVAVAAPGEDTRVPGAAEASDGEEAPAEAPAARPSRRTAKAAAAEPAAEAADDESTTADATEAAPDGDAAPTAD
jgi:large subunit ribosomal protein L15